MSEDTTLYDSADKRQVGGSYYKTMGVQPWTVMESVMTPEAFRGFLLGNVIKYAMRAGRKAGSDDLSKAIHYLQRIQEHEKLHKVSNP